MPFKIRLCPLFIVSCWYTQFFISLKVILADRYDLVACIWTYQSEGEDPWSHDHEPLTLLDQAGIPENHLDLMRNECVHESSWQMGKFPKTCSLSCFKMGQSLSHPPYDQDAIDVDCNGSMTWEDARLAVKQGFHTSCTSCAFRGFASFVISLGPTGTEK